MLFLLRLVAVEIQMLRVEPAVRVATSNWHSFNILSKVIQTELTDAGIEVEEVYFDSLGEAFKAMWNGELDVIPETGPCVNHDDCSTGFCAKDAQCRPCDDCTSCTSGIDQTCSPACSQCAISVPAPVQLNVASHPWGFSITEGIFLPHYMEGLSPSVPSDWTDAHTWTGDAALSDNVLEIVGPLVNWGAHGVVDALADPLNLDLTVTTPSSATDLQRTVFDRMMWKNRFAFYAYTPHPITTEYPVSQVTLPQKQGGGAYFTASQRQMVWRMDINAQAATVLEGITWSWSEVGVHHAIRNISLRVSLTLEEQSAAYGELIRVAANALLCELGGKPTKCGDTAPRFWPQRKAEGIPSEIVVSVRQCDGFIECKDSSGTALDVPLHGYSVDHAKEILRLIGYQESEVTYKCFNGTFNEAVKFVSMELAHIGHSCITVLARRQPLVDFSSPFYSSGLIVVVKNEQEKQTFLDELVYLLLSGFDAETWGNIVLFGFFAVVWIGVFETCTEVRAKRSKRAKIGAAQQTNSDASLRPLALAKRCVEVGAQVATGKKEVMDLHGNCSRVGAVFLAALYFLSLAVYAANLTLVKTSEMLDGLKIEGREQLRANGKVATDCESSMGSWLRAYEPDIELLCMPTIEEMQTAILQGTARALIIDTPMAQSLVANNCQYRTAGKSFAAQDYGMVFPKNSPLLKYISAAVTHLRENEEWHANSYAKYFLGECSSTEKGASESDEESLAQSLSVINIVGLMIVAFIGLLLSCLTTLTPDSEPSTDPPKEDAMGAK
eukprot:GEMP01014732.1.p1 GENE.GEMP01014732.1~~GEMP01014732.1.p1  ORF type:complete len:781 (+),score=156.60 GEMP01014732.1:90-2432(+)